MKRTLTAAILGAMALFPLTTAAASPATVTPMPGFLTVQFGRAMEGSFTGSSAQCIPVPGMNNLTYEAQDLAARGMTGTAAVVVANTGATAEQCKGGEIYSDWPDLQSLVTTSGWSVISAGLTYSNVGQMTLAEQQQEICGSLPAFQSYGLDASGMFAYPNNSWTVAVQTQVTQTCFDYGRSYKGKPNLEASMNPDGMQGTYSILGGMCEALSTGGSCTQPGPISGQKGKTYQSPTKLEATVAAEGDNQWIDLQFYKLVSGAGSDGPTFSWDCTSSDPTQHWTSQPEIYCQNDFDAILAAVPAGIVSAGPEAVAAAWGVVLP